MKRPGDTGFTYLDTATGATTYLDTAADPGTESAYLLRAVDDAGNVSADSATVTATRPHKVAPVPGADAVVDPDGDGDFTSVQAALTALGAGTAAPRVVPPRRHQGGALPELDLRHHDVLLEGLLLPRVRQHRRRLRRLGHRGPSPALTAEEAASYEKADYLGDWTPDLG
ncbi:hypothetical protein [Streptomyces tailanensis]|uniref:hypothetical protein n=1 Tax=Streptomyces tailanensis TaxID=2569858 RepID=UPI001FE9E5CD|nr:hypothetical protein [Streptomyces tailanensis]